MEERALLFIQAIPVKTACPFQQLGAFPVGSFVQIKPTVFTTALL